MKKRLGLGPIAFATKQEFGALQAADFLAYETYKQITATLTRSSRSRLSIRPIVDGVKLYANYMREEDAERAFKEWPFGQPE